MNQEDIDYFYEKYGQPIDKVEVTEDITYTPRSQFKKYTVKHVCFSTLSA